MKLAVFRTLYGMEYRKIYVETDVRFSREGRMFPLSLVWEDGRRFYIDKVKSVDHAAARVGAMLPIRYTCAIEGAEKYIYFEPTEKRWFVEVAATRN